MALRLRILFEGVSGRLGMGYRTCTDGVSVLREQPLLRFSVVVMNDGRYYFVNTQKWRKYLCGRRIDEKEGARQNRLLL